MTSAGKPRREFIAAAGAAALVFRLGDVRATAAEVRATLAKITGGRPVTKGRVKLDVPPLIDNGNAVALAVRVDSPMTAADHVKAIHLFAPENPLPQMLTVHLGPRAGKAAFATRVRVADSQTLMAVAELSDGTFWSDSFPVVVTMAACLEELK